jgi:hypothetical protein
MQNQNKLRADAEKYLSFREKLNGAKVIEFSQ